MDLERALSASARRIEPAIGRLLDRKRVRRVLHARALRAWRATDEPLIVCYGNINRSPFAEQLLRRQAGANPGSAGPNASSARPNPASAGLYMRAGRPSPPLTVAVAAAHGVDLSAHRSAILDGEEIDRAPAIFLFDLDNLARIAARRPSALRKTHFLGALAQAGSPLIADPHGRGQEALEEAFTSIEQALACAGAERD